MPPGGTKTVFSRDRHERMRRIEVLLAKQYTTKQMIRIIQAEEEPPVSERQVYTDIAEVYATIQAEDADERAIRLARARRTWARQYRRCVDKGDMSAANYALDRICKLDGLYAPKKIEVSGTLSLSARVTSLVGILDADGIAALELIQRQIAAARDNGLLPAPVQDESMPSVIDVDHSENDS